MLSTAPGPRSRRAVAAVPVLLLVLALAGCGGSSGSASSGSASAATATSRPADTGAAPGGGPAGGIDFTAIQACLTAAGISVPVSSGRPAGGTPPSGTAQPNPTPPAGAMPNGTPPTGAAADLGRGPGAALFSSAKVKAALAACGITLPTGGPRPGATGSTG
jgi:hypothetical protein